MTIDQMRLDMARRNKKGLAFILASIIIWTGVLIVWRLPLEGILTRNLLTFFCTAPLMPLAFLFSKIIKAEFAAKDNPLNNLGLLFSLNQLLYLPIAMWVFPTVPTKMVMIIAMIFGAHLLPFSWLYQSKAYLVTSIVTPLLALAVGYNQGEEQVFILAGMMIVVEIIFALWLVVENRQLAVENIKK